MFAKTHQILAHHIANHVKQELNYTLDSHTFAWSNMKPDFVPHLAVRKHYIEESFPFVVERILYLIHTPSDYLADDKKKKWVQSEIGVICHFVSDFFCVPHNQRWEFKHSMIPHVKYETKLEGIAKDVSLIDKLSLPSLDEVSKESVSLFLRELLDEYEQKKDYQRDLLYSVNVCTAISTFILNSIMSNAKEPKYLHSFTA